LNGFLDTYSKSIVKQIEVTAFANDATCVVKARAVLLCCCSLEVQLKCRNQKTSTGEVRLLLAFLMVYVGEVS
jgi:hypothetical protein